MTWARPDLFALLLLVPAVAVLLVLAERERRRILTAFAAVEVLPTLLLKGVVRARVAQVVFAIVALAALAVGAAGPRLGFEWQQQPVEGVSIVAVLDVSRSMDAADVSPSRMVRARRELQDFVALLRGDAIGLVVFAAGPYVRIPLTVDYDTFLWAVEDSSTDTIRAQGSDLSAALDAAVGLLSKASGSGKAILLLSDGEGHQEESDLGACLDRAKAADIRIYTLGIGEPSGAPIPLAEGGFKSDSSGNVVLTRLDEASLQAVAAATGGAYVRAVPSDEDVRALYEGEIRGKLDAAERGVRREKLWHERFQWALAIGLAAMAMSALLGIGRRPRGLGAAAAVLFVGLASSPLAWAGATEDGLTAMREKRWSDAANLLGQARVDHPNDAVVSRALAEALYRSGRFREAEQLYETLATTDAANKATHLFNAGNAAYRGGRLDEALEDFSSAGKVDPKLVAAEKNATAVQREIATRLQKEREQQEQQDGDQQDGQPQDGQQGQPQEGQQGQPQEGQQGQPQEGQQGQPQEGQQGQPQQGQPQEDQQGQPQDQQPGVAEGDPTAATREGGEPGVTGEPTDGLDISATTEGEGDPSGAVSTGQMSAEQAERLVDSVKDGTPRVVVGGRGSEKDW